MPPFCLSPALANEQRIVALFIGFSPSLSLSLGLCHSLSLTQSCCGCRQRAFQKLNDEKTNKMPFDEKRIYLLCLPVCARLCEIYFTAAAANSLIRFSMV